MATQVIKQTNNLGIVTAIYEAPATIPGQSAETVIEARITGLAPIFFTINIRDLSNLGPVVIEFTLTEDGRIVAA